MREEITKVVFEGPLLNELSVLIGEIPHKYAMGLLQLLQKGAVKNPPVDPAVEPEVVK